MHAGHTPPVSYVITSIMSARRTRVDMLDRPGADISRHIQLDMLDRTDQCISRISRTIQQDTMKDKGIYSTEDFLDRQSLPLYFSDQSKYHSHTSLEPVTQLTRVVSLPRDTATPRENDIRQEAILHWLYLPAEQQPTEARPDG